MQPDGVVADARLSQQLIKTRISCLFQNIQDALIKRVHNRLKYAKADLKPFLTICAHLYTYNILTLII